MQGEDSFQPRHNRGMTWQTLTTVPNTLGESPFWHPLEQQLYWVDIAARLICRCNVFMGSVETWAMPTEPGCIAPALGGIVHRLAGQSMGTTWSVAFVAAPNCALEPVRLAVQAALDAVVAEPGGARLGTHLLERHGARHHRPCRP